MNRKLAIILMLILATTAFSSNKKPEYKKNREMKAIRTHEKIIIDGILSEKVWQNPGTDDFVMSEPIDGGEPTEKTIVWLAYDDKAIYVAARLFDSQPDKIVARLGRRDDRIDSDWFTFAIDPYFDRRSGFLFSVNPAGSIRDATLYNDSWKDYTWDGVWEWAVKVDDKGWTVELRIPYNQLRFQKKEKYVWGVNFSRFIMRKQELDTYVWIPKGDNAYVSHFAKLTGIEGINPGIFVEATPYMVGDITLSPKEEGNPFKTGHSYYANTGLDFKLGIKTNLTLTATINPDFGQVEVDPAVINLTAYETYYEEKRPFFIEGSSIFNFGKGGSTMQMNINWGDPQFFYSRRIGRTPRGYVSSNGYVKYPDRTTILGAAKITGKIGNGWNVGILDAITAREYAEIDLNGTRSSQEVEPLTNYNVVRIQKEFNEGRQGLGFITTSVFRNPETEEIESLLPRKSLVFGVDGWSFLDKSKKWVLTGWFGTSYVEGSKDSIFNLQHSPLHYFQRPDASHLKLDENATSMSGWAGKLYFNKEKGNWLFNASIAAISPGFEVNDMGFQFKGDIINSQLITGYIWFHPGKVFRTKILATGGSFSYDFGGTPLARLLLLMAHGELLNYWGGEVIFGYFPKSYDRDLTRGGPLARSPEGIFVRAKLFSDRRKPIVGFLTAQGAKTNTGEGNISVFLNLKWKPRSNISLSFGPQYFYRYSIAQWVTKVEDPLKTETYGYRYIFADIVQHTISSSIRINWSFTPKLSLQAYIQPFIATGDYSRLKELRKSKTYDFKVYGEEGSTVEFDGYTYTVDPDGIGPAEPFSVGNPDFNIKSLRGTVVLRWEYRPGSTLYLVWTQNRMDYANTGILNFGQDFMDMLTAPGDNIFLLKITYRWGK